MALRVWLPLNGDLHNQGLSDVEVTNNNAVVNTNGKIGKCYQFGTGTSYLELPSSCMNSFTECSVAFWIKILTWQTNYCTFFDAAINSDAWTSYVFGFLRNSTASTCCFTISNGSSASNASYLTPELDLNTWYHITLTYKTGHCCIYINGELYKDYTTTIVPAFNRITKIRVGKAYSGYQSNCLMNDLKIYDHCLLPLEIKKISQGLVLHYRLGGIGGENLLANSKLDGSWTYPSSSYSDKYSPITLKIPSGSVYTLSFDAKSTINGDKIRTHYYSPNTTTTCVSSQGITKTATDGNMDFTLSIEWKRYWVKYSQSETTAVKHVICPRLVSGQGVGTISVKNVKLEEGSYPTPWCPAPSDNEYSKMGLDDNIEYDCSGYGNNGIRSEITCNSDTARYTGSYEFTSPSKITLPVINYSNFGNSWTFCAWLKTSKDNMMPWGPSNGNRLNLYSSNGVLYNNTGDGSNNPFMKDGTNVASSAILDYKWHHIAVTGDGTSNKLYIDGELAGTAKTYKPLTATQYYLSGWLASNAYYYQGLMSDFRIYATALSADDVLDLYRLGGSIDSNGVFHTYEYVEGE